MILCEGCGTIISYGKLVPDHLRSQVYVPGEDEEDDDEEDVN